MSLRPGQSYKQIKADSEPTLKKAQLSYREMKDQGGTKSEEPMQVDPVEKKLISWRERLNQIRAAAKRAFK